MCWKDALGELKATCKSSVQEKELEQALVTTRDPRSLQFWVREMT